MLLTITVCFLNNCNNKNHQQLITIEMHGLLRLVLAGGSCDSPLASSTLSIQPGKGEGDCFLKLWLA
jgi:hypothetical protein